MSKENKITQAVKQYCEDQGVFPEDRRSYAQLQKAFTAGLTFAAHELARMAVEKGDTTTSCG